MMPESDVFAREPLPLPTAAEAADADRRAREQWQVPERVLMENAGRAAALVLQRLHPTGSVVGLAGSGNNGGDLLVMLRTLQSWGRDVAVIAAGSAAPAAALAHGEAMTVVSDDVEAERLLLRADILVDGMLGTGASGAPRGRIAQWIERLAAVPAPVVALDLPSGVDATTGRVDGAAVRADVTVGFGWPKLGLLLHPARQHCGRLLAVEIGFPPAVADGFGAHAITPRLALRHLPQRTPDAHKGSAGRLLVLAGGAGMAGAAAITAAAAQRACAGLVRIASAAANHTALHALVPEATLTDWNTLSRDDVGVVQAAVAGPGLGQDGHARGALERLFIHAKDTPLLLDADALNMLAREPGTLRKLAERLPVVITPHARELARLTGTSLEHILADMPAAARAAADRFGCVVLLKGQPTLVAAPGGALFVNLVGSSDLATGGMGDQLAGVIGALMAGGTEPLEAACTGLYLSGRSADLLARGRSLSPRDVSEGLPAAIMQPPPRASALDLPFITFDQPPRW